MNYICVNGHDKCEEMYPSEQCPYCLVEPSNVLYKLICRGCGQEIDTRRNVETLPEPPKMCYSCRDVRTEKSMHKWAVQKGYYASHTIFKWYNPATWLPQVYWVILEEEIL